MAGPRTLGILRGTDLNLLKAIQDLCDKLEALANKVDYEYISSGPICIDDTWQYEVITLADGVETSRIYTDTGVSCDDPKPAEPQIEKIRYCNIATGTLFDKVCLYTFPDPADQTNVVETIVSETDTGLACEDAKVEVKCQYICNYATGVYDLHTITVTDGVPAPAVVTPTAIPCRAAVVTNDVEYVCNTDTGVYEQILTVTTNGVVAAPVITATVIPCAEDEPDFEPVRVCNADGFIHIVTYQFAGDGTQSVLSDVGTAEPCVPAAKQTVNVEDCDGNQVEASVDQEVAIRGVVTVRQCPEEEAADQAILDELKALNSRPLGVIESCDGSEFWTVNPDGTTNGPFANPSAPVEAVK